MPIAVKRRRFTRPRIEPVVIIAASIAAITLLQFRMIHVRAAVRLAHHDALATHPKLLPHFVCADHRHVPTNAAGWRSSPTHNWGFILRSGTQPRTGNDAVHFGASQEEQTDKSPAAH